MLNKLKIVDLPDSFFENPSTKHNISGFAYFDEEINISDVTGVRIKLSSTEMQYENISIFFEGKINTRFTCHIHGDNIEVAIGANVSGAYFVKLWPNTRFKLGSKTTANSLEAWVQREGEIEIGEDCMFAHNVHLQCGDMHGIFDLETQKQINNSSPRILIGNHVWLARNCTVLKDISIGSGSIVGISALVTRSIEKNTLVAGAPAKALRHNVSWTRTEVCSDGDMKFLTDKLTE